MEVRAAYPIHRSWPPAACLLIIVAFSTTLMGNEVLSTPVLSAPAVEHGSKHSFPYLPSRPLVTKIFPSIGVERTGDRGASGDEQPLSPNTTGFASGRNPILTCPTSKNFKALRPHEDRVHQNQTGTRYAPLAGSVTDVSTCCTWSDPEHKVTTYAACSLSDTFWQDWGDLYSGTQPNFMARGNSICSSLLSTTGAADPVAATLFYAFPDQIRDGTYSAAAAKVTELMEAQVTPQTGLGRTVRSALGSVLTAGSVTRTDLTGNGTPPSKLRWSLVADLTVVPEDPNVCRADGLDLDVDIESSFKYVCDWQSDYGGTAAESLFSFQDWQDTENVHLALAFKADASNQQIPDWNLGLIGARDIGPQNSRIVWEWDPPASKPYYILCQLPAEREDQTTTEQGSTTATAADNTQTSEWTAPTSTATDTTQASEWTTPISTLQTTTFDSSPSSKWTSFTSTMTAPTGTATDTTQTSEWTTPISTLQTTTFDSSQSSEWTSFTSTVTAPTSTVLTSSESSQSSEWTTLPSTQLTSSSVLPDVTSTPTQPTTEKLPCCQTPEDSIAFQDGISDFCGSSRVECPKGWWGRFELLLCKEDAWVVWKRRCNPQPDLDNLFDVDATPTENLQILSDMIVHREGNVTSDNLDVIVDGLGPITDEFLLFLQNATNPTQAFQLADNYTHEFLNVVDNMIDLEQAWRQYDPEKANGTAANTKLLSDLERAGEILASQELPNGKRTIDSRNTLLGVTRRTASEVIALGNHSLYFPDEQAETFIKIPPGYHILILSNEKVVDSTQDVKTIGVLMKKSEDAIFPGRNLNGTKSSKKKVNTNILAFKFVLGNSTVPMKLETGAEGITLKMKHGLRAMQPHYETILRDLHPGEKPTAVPDSALCTFLKPEDSSWSKEGCWLRQTSEDETICECSHLTNFAVLMDVHGYVGKNLGLEIMGYVIGSLSAICLAINVIVFQFVRGASRTPTGVLTKHLSGTLLLGHLITSTAFDKTYFVISDLVCSLVAATVHFLFLSAFCWMLLEGYVLYVRLVYIFQQDRATPLWKYMCFGYFVPLCIVAVTYGLSAGLGHDGYGRGEFCWLRSPDYIWAFAGPVLLIILANGFFAVMALRSARSSFKHQQQATIGRKQNMMSIRGCVSLTCILGLGWFLGYLYVAHTPIFAYLFTLVNASQGIWIFLFHVFLNDTVSTALRRYLERKKASNEWSNSKSVSQSAVNRILNILENPVLNGRRRTKRNAEAGFASSSKEHTSTTGATRLFSNGGGHSSSAAVNPAGDATRRVQLNSANSGRARVVHNDDNRDGRMTPAVTLRG